MAFSLSIPLRGTLLQNFVTFIQHPYGVPCDDSETEGYSFLVYVALFAIIYLWEACTLAMSCRMIFKTITTMEANLRDQTFRIVSEGNAELLEVGAPGHRIRHPLGLCLCCGLWEVFSACASDQYSTSVANFGLTPYIVYSFLSLLLVLRISLRPTCGYCSHPTFLWSGDLQ